MGTGHVRQQAKHMETRIAHTFLWRRGYFLRISTYEFNRLGTIYLMYECVTIFRPSSPLFSHKMWLICILKMMWLGKIMNVPCLTRQMEPLLRYYPTCSYLSFSPSLVHHNLKICQPKSRLRTSPVSLSPALCISFCMSPNLFPNPM